MQLKDEYVINMIYEHARRPIHARSANVYNFECPICNEGKSRGKKRRAFFLPADHRIHCHNCGWHSQPAKWIHTVTGKSYQEIRNENLEFISNADDIVQLDLDTKPNRVSLTLPEDSINLYSDIEVAYYRGDPWVTKALEYVKSRRLNTAKFRPKALYISLKDHLYANTLCFPFYNLDSKIDFFQVRELEPGVEPKYRGKLNGEKTIFNIDKVDQSFPYIFLFEGPIDCMFVKNGVALAGTNLTQKQQAVLNMFPLHQKIWCLDNQAIDNTSRDLTRKLLENKQRVFIWPKKYHKYKDVNDICCAHGLDEISTTWIIENTKSSVLDGLLN